MTTLADVMTRAIQFQAAGNLDQAAALYRQVLAAAPHELNAHYRLAVVCQLQGRSPEAAILYEQLLQLQPAAANVQNNLGLVYASQGRLTEALACCEQAVRLMPYCAEFSNNLGTVQMSLGDWDQAANAFRRALVLNPRYAAVLSNLGRTHLAQQRLDEAVRCFQDALALQPGNVADLGHLGKAYFGQGKTAEAGDCFRQMLRLQPNDAEAAFNLAQVCTLLQRWDEAAACLQNCLSIDPGNVPALAALGDLFYFHMGKLPEALRCYQRLLTLRPDNAKVRLYVEALSGSSRRPQLPADFMADQYDSLAGEWDQKVQRRGDRSIQWLKEALEPAPEARSLAILDLGCGTGLSGLQFRDWAATLIGVDLSPQMLNRASERGVYDELLLSDAVAALQGRADQFDLIVASDVLLYVGDLGPIFEAVQRALRPGGRFGFTVDLHDGPDDFRLTPWVHYSHSRAYLHKLATETKMREISVQEVQFPRDGGQQAAGLVIVLARL